jgi:hypothetical protein
VKKTLAKVNGVKMDTSSDSNQSPGRGGGQEKGQKEKVVSLCLNLLN